jgi:hypothetical protein
MRILAPFGLLLIVLGLSGGAWYVWDKIGDAIIPAGRYPAVLGALVLIFAACSNWLTGRGLLKRSALVDERVWAAGLVAIFLSDWMNRPWGLFGGPSIRGELLVAFAVAYWIIRSERIGLFLALPVVSVALLVWSFFLASDGSLLFSDDHAMFIFRLKLLRENFPLIPFWSPLWNAGFDARDFFATGALNAFLLAAPLIYSAPIETIYPYLISFLLWILVPGCTYAAARILGFSKLTAAIAATLSVSSSSLWYRWALKYGTIGFITSAALLPLVVALAIRHLSAQKPLLRESFALCVVTTLMLLWSPSGIAALPVAIAAIPLYPRLIRSKRHILTLALLLAVNLPWMSMMWKVSKVGRFLNAAQSHTTTGAADIAAQPNQLPAVRETNTFRHEAGAVSGKKTLTQWHNFAASLNPVVLVCAVPALLALPASIFRYWALLSIWLTLLGTVGVSLKPQLELDRMLILNSVLLTIPIGSYIANLLLKPAQGLSWRIAASIIGAFVLISPFTAASIVLNRGDDTYTFANQDVHTLARVIQENVGEGRVLFSGCVLHELSGGHLGPLPLWANAPMIASSYAHNIWRYEQPFPQTALNRGDTGIREFLDLSNATLVVAHEPTWVEYFQKRPDEYTQVWRGERFFLFQRTKYTPSYTLSGSLESFSYSSNSVSFTPTSETLTLKFKFFPFLTSTACSLRPFSTDLGFDLVQLEGCTPGKPVTISSVSPITRLITPGL